MKEIEENTGGEKQTSSQNGHEDGDSWRCP